MQLIVKKGKWTYAEEHLEKIIIVEQDWDELYENGYSEDDPYLNSDGLVYFIHYGEYQYNEFGNIFFRSMLIPFLIKETTMACIPDLQTGMGSHWEEKKA